MVALELVLLPPRLLMVEINPQTHTISQETKFWLIFYYSALTLRTYETETTKQNSDKATQFLRNRPHGKNRLTLISFFALKFRLVYWFHCFSHTALRSEKFPFFFAVAITTMIVEVCRFFSFSLFFFFSASSVFIFCFVFLFTSRF